MMNKCIALLAAVLLAVCLCTTATQAQPVSADTARVAAQNHVDRTIVRLGNWGGAQQAQATDVQAFGRKGRDLGYIVTVQPDGYVILFNNRRMPTVKAYSANGRLDITQDKGPADLIKGRMLKAVDRTEKRLGKQIAAAQNADWAQLADTADQTPAWDAMTSGTLNLPAAPPVSTYEGMDYQPGQFLLTTHWYQDYPYNAQCPYMDCSGQPNGRALVGCVATAGVQVLRYWNWPPCDSTGGYVDAYTWSNMPVTISGSSPQDQIDCVAAACRSVGNSVSMDYGCGSSGAYTEDMEQVFENRRYPSAGVADRSAFTNSEWYDRVTSQISENQPVQYRVDEHSIVGDGWYTEDVGGVTQKWYHFNYGWGAGADIWYLFDDYPLGAGDDEFMVRRLYPDVSLNQDLAGSYPQEFLSVNHFDKPTRYFNRDCTGVNATFAAGQAFQYVRPGLWIRNTGTLSTDAITFQGTPAGVSEFYQSAPYGDKRIRVLDSVIKIHGGGEMRLR
jgi:hypothetical protein